MGATVSWAPLWQIVVSTAVAFAATAVLTVVPGRADPWTRSMRRLIRRMERRAKCASKTRYSAL